MKLNEFYRKIPLQSIYFFINITPSGFLFLLLVVYVLLLYQLQYRDQYMTLITIILHTRYSSKHPFQAERTQNVK